MGLEICFSIVEMHTRLRFSGIMCIYNVLDWFCNFLDEGKWFSPKQCGIMLFFHAGAYTCIFAESASVCNVFDRLGVWCEKWCEILHISHRLVCNMHISRVYGMSLIFFEDGSCFRLVVLEI